MWTVENPRCCLRFLLMNHSLADLPRPSKKPADPRTAAPHLLHCPPVATSILSGLPKFQPGAFWLFVVTLITSAVLADQPVAASLALGRPFADQLALWQPLSAVFLFPNGTLTGLVGTLLLQWFVAGHLEVRWGTARYLTFAVGSAVFGYLALGRLGLPAPAALASPHGGTPPADLAVVIGFGFVYGRAPMQLFGALPISARAFAGVLTGVLVLAPLLRGNWPETVPPAAAAALAGLLAWRWRLSGDSGKVAPRGNKKQRPRHLEVVKPARPNKPRLLN